MTSRREGHLSNPKAQERLREQQKFLIEQRKRDLAAVMATAEGRRFIWRLMHVDCGYGDDFNAGADELKRLGRRSVAVRLIEELNADHTDAYLQMHGEMVRRDQEARLHKQAAEAAKNTESEE